MNALLLPLLLSLVFILASVFISPYALLFVCLSTAILQFHTLPVLGFYPSVTLLSGLALWPELMKSKQCIRFVPILLLFALLLTYSISLAWSPDIRLGIRNIIYTLPFIFIFIISYRLSRKNFKHTVFILSVALIMALIEAFLVIVFRLSPSIEDRFLHSELAKLFITPNILNELFDTARNNVLDPAKAGGFFTNANVASTYLGVHSCLALGLGRALKRIWFIGVAILLWLAVFFTGSKAGIILALTFPVVLIMLPWISGQIKIKVNVTLQKSLILFLIFAFILGTLISYVIMIKNVTEYINLISRLFQESQNSLSIRMQIWDFAVQEFTNKPFFGHGFGGWQPAFLNYAAVNQINQNYPPHNSLVYLWSQSGIAALIIGVLFIIFILGFALRGSLTMHYHERMISSGTLSAFLWMFVQGLGSNFGVIGEIHVLPILAAFLGFNYAHRVEIRKKLKYEQRRDIPPPII